MKESAVEPSSSPNRYEARGKPRCPVCIAAHSLRRLIRREGEACGVETGRARKLWPEHLDTKRHRLPKGAWGDRRLQETLGPRRSAALRSEAEVNRHDPDM